MDNNFEGPFEALEGLFEGLINESPQRLYSCLFDASERPKIYISAPSILVSFLLRGITQKYKLLGESNKMFRGINIIPSSDYALTLFHEDYAIFKEEWMIHKISLDPLFASKPESHITKYVGQIQKFIPKQIGKDSSMN